jgi:hypothetical protein
MTLRIVNPEFEARNPKQYQNPKIKMTGQNAKIAQAQMSKPK